MLVHAKGQSLLSMRWNIVMPFFGVRSSVKADSAPSVAHQGRFSFLI